MTKLIVAFRYFANAPKKCHDGRSKDKDLNHGPCEKEAGVLLSQLRDLKLQCRWNIIQILRLNLKTTFEIRRSLCLWCLNNLWIRPGIGERLHPRLRTRGVRGKFKDTFMPLAQRAIKDAEELNAVASFIIRQRTTHREHARTQASLRGTRKNEMRCCPPYSAWHAQSTGNIIPYPTAFPYGNGVVLHFYQQQESSTAKTVHKVINKGLKAYV